MPFEHEPIHPEILPGDEPVLDGTKNDIVAALRAKMGDGDGWTGCNGDAIVDVNPLDIQAQIGEVASVVVPIPGFDIATGTEYVVKIIPDGIDIEKRFSHHIEFDYSTPPTRDEIRTASETVRSIAADEGIQLAEPTEEDYDDIWKSLMISWIQDQMPTAEEVSAVEATERELGLKLVTETEGRALLELIRGAITIEG